MSYKIDTIVLEARECREYDRIYTLLSREKGKISAIGVGTRKPKAKLASGLEPLTKNELFLIECRGLDRIKGVIIHDQYPKIRENYDKTILVRRTTRILSWLLLEGERCEDIFLALADFLTLVEKTSFENKDVGRSKVVLFQLALFWRGVAWLGITPSLYYCVSCRKKISKNDKFIFSVPNGLRCEKCFANKDKNSMYISTDSVKILRFFLEGEVEILKKIKFDRKVLAELSNITRYTLSHIIERRIIF